MVKVKFIWTMLMLVVLASCSQSFEPKKIKPTTDEFSSGELSKYIKIDDYQSKLSFSQKSGAIATQFIKLDVELKLKNGVPEKLKGVDAHDVHFVKLLSVAVINIEDEQGNTIQDLSIKDEDMLKLKKLLTGEESYVEVSFVGEYHNAKDAPKWFKEAKQYTPYLTADITVGDGLVAKKKASSSSDDDEDDVDDDVDDDEDDENDSSAVLDETPSMTSSSKDIDAALDTYEKIIDRYFECFEKAKSGDMDAVAEYTEIMAEAQKAGEKFVNAQNNFTPSQLKRYTKLYKKIMESVEKNGF